VERDDKKTERNEKVDKVRLQKFLKGQVGSSVKMVDVAFYYGW